MIEIVPSILAANFSQLAQEIMKVEKHVKCLHIDVMDGHFVPNITVGPAVITSLRPITTLEFDVHLMITKPQRYIDAFIDAGADSITFHVETGDVKAINRTIDMIRARGKKVGLSLNPGTPVTKLNDFLEKVDLILCMTVEAGFGGQKFMLETLQKIREIAKRIEQSGLPIILQVDGGINEETARLAVKAGANVLVAGSAVFKQPDPARAIQDILQAIELNTN
ncbi:MAG: ribulose-phosphate 3-epimerase [Candidatus Odinarchaeota archaeon]